MSDPIDQIFNGTPEDFDEEKAKQAQAAADQAIADSQPMVAREDGEIPDNSVDVSPDLKPDQPKQEAKEPEQEQPADPATPMSVDDILAGKGPVMPGEAAATGAIDWAVDLFNKVPGASVPKLPEYQDDVATSIRDISSVVTPTIALSITGIGALSQAGKASKLKILSDPFVKWLGTTGASAGIGVGVDYVAKTNEEDDNVLGTLKKNFPKTWGWVPDDLATLDSDSPDQKRAKNVYESLGLGIFTDLVGGAVKLGAALKGSLDATRWIPESEKAKTWLKNNAPDAAEDVVEKGVAKRTEDLDNLGGYNFSKSQNLDEPIFGLHDMYGYEEMGIRSADDMGIVGASVDQARIINNLDTTYESSR